MRGLVVSRQRVCQYCGDLHEVNRWPHNCMPPAPQRSDYPSPYVVSDNLPGGVNGLFHHGVAKKIDSKAAYRRATKDSGCIEIGNERIESSVKEDVTMRRDVIESGVNEALHQLGISSDSDMGKINFDG